MSGNIIRVQKPDKYAVVAQDMLRDSRLSFAARGLLSYLLSKPNDWEMRTEDLIAQSPAGRDAIYAILKELETHGYLVRYRVRDLKGHVSWETKVFESPELAAPYQDSPNTAEPDTARPNTGKPHSKELSSDEVQNNSAQATPSQSGARKAKVKKSSQKPNKRDERRRDPRTNHPAIRMVETLTGYFPRLILYDDVIATMGEHPDFQRAKACALEWAKRNYRMDNHNWIFDWYVNGIPEKGNGKDSKQPNSNYGKPSVTRDFSKYRPRTG